MKITVTKRGHQSKGERSRRKRLGYIPGAIYGRGLETTLVEVPAKGVADILLSESGQNTIVDLDINGEGQTHTVLLNDLVRDPVTRSFVHVGFHQVQKGEKVTAHIPIQFVGTPAAVKNGDAILEQNLETIAVQGASSDLPAHLDVDVSQLKLGDVLHVSDLPHNDKLTFSAAENTAIAAVHASRTAQAVEATEAIVHADAVTPPSVAPGEVERTEAA